MTRVQEISIKSHSLSNEMTQVLIRLIFYRINLLVLMYYQKKKTLKKIKKAGIKT